MTKACVVTGAAGFIGSHLVDRLLVDGWTVVGVDDLSSGSIDNLAGASKFSGFHFVNRSVCDAGLLDELKVTYPELNTVFHLAAISSVPRSIKDSNHTFLVNYVSTVRLLSKAEKLGFETFVFAGSAAEYGASNSQEQLVEGAARSDIQWPSPYGLSKYLATVAVTASPIGVSLRCFNVYGPRQRCTEDGGVLSIFVDKLLLDEPLIIYGDGFQTRDFLYVSDAAEAYLLATKLRGAYNVAYGVSVQLVDVVGILRALTKKEIDIKYMPGRSSDILYSAANITAFTKATDWHPTIPLGIGLGKTIASRAELDAGS